MSHDNMTMTDVMLPLHYIFHLNPKQRKRKMKAKIK